MDMAAGRRIGGIDADAVLFDMDGVLVDSGKSWFRAFNEAGGVSEKEFTERFRGRDMNENLKAVNTTGGHFCGVVYPKHAGEVKLFPDTKQALGEIRLKKAVTTNAIGDCARQILRRLDLEKYFDAIVTRDMVSEGKPQPHMLLRACEMLGVDPRRAVMVGDSGSDIEAGRRAGCVTVGLGGIEGDHKVESLTQLSGMLK